MKGRWMVWSGSEEQQRFGGSVGHLYRGEGKSPDCHVLSAAGKEASHDGQQSSVLVVGRAGERERECACARACRARGAAAPGGAQSIRRPGEC